MGSKGVEKQTRHRICTTVYRMEKNLTKPKMIHVDFYCVCWLE